MSPVWPLVGSAMEGGKAEWGQRLSPECVECRENVGQWLSGGRELGPGRESDRHRDPLGVNPGGEDSEEAEGEGWGTQAQETGIRVWELTLTF